MSTTLLLFIVASAAPVVVFADSAMQWSLRLILDGDFRYGFRSYWARSCLAS